MSKKALTIFIVITIGILLGIIAMESRRAKAENAAFLEALASKNPIYYYGITCPNCKDVEKFMTDNKIEEKITIIKKEVFNNTANSIELSKVAQKCNLDPTKVGVPFIYFQGKCFEGRPDVEKFLSEKAGLLVLPSATSPTQ